MLNYKEHLRKIKVFVFDYDGVLTDGNVILLNDGDVLRSANVKDGYAMQLAAKKGYRIVIISGGKSDSILRRFEVLKITDVFLGVENKIEVFENYLAENRIEPAEVLYMGDDIPDYEIMQRVGVPTCPADAAEEIKSISKYISHKNGGHGCVRDVIEQVLKIQGQWMNHGAFHW
ncbi:MAG: HAD-IIIA family hydrolase [Bacteroidales bacterium]|nr:HAD-IIIA family hydrolase [Bacteroidales bacterium]MDZ4203622.1 HAD-IIIA family hydrolase [Bacteroidales bacterium]